MSRWQQRFENFRKALFQLQKFYDKAETLNELEIIGLIKSFEHSYELAWNTTMKDFYEDEGEVNIQESKDAISLSLQRGLVADGNVWKTVHHSSTMKLPPQKLPKKLFIPTLTNSVC